MVRKGTRLHTGTTQPRTTLDWILDHINFFGNKETAKVYAMDTMDKLKKNGLQNEEAVVMYFSVNQDVLLLAMDECDNIQNLKDIMEDIEWEDDEVYQQHKGFIEKKKIGTRLVNKLTRNLEESFGCWYENEEKKIYGNNGRPLRSSITEIDHALTTVLCSLGFNGWAAHKMDTDDIKGGSGVKSNNFHAEIMFCNPRKHLNLIKVKKVKTQIS